MKKGETMTTEVLNGLIESFQSRMKNFGIKKESKKYKDAQQEFMVGACVGIDKVLGNVETTCIPPAIYFDVMRGVVMEVQKPKTEKA